jgi:hypothetical protein
MERLVSLWRRTGGSVTGFVRTHGVSRGRFDYWRRRLEEPVRGFGVAGRPGTRLVPVRVVDEGQGGEVEIILAGGDRVRVGAGVSAEVLGRVVEVLRRTC